MAISKYYLTQNLSLSFNDKLERYCHLMKSASSLYHANALNPKMDSLNISEDEILDILDRLHKHHVKFLIVGGMAVMFHGYIRATQDIDLWIKNDPANKKNLIEALKSGVPGLEYFRDPQFVMGYTTFPYGEKGIVLDMGTSMVLFAEDDFDACFERADVGEINEIPFRVINITDLINEKTAAARLQDLLDTEHLNEIVKQRKGQ
jgi:hypothetical protein